MSAAKKLHPTFEAAPPHKRWRGTLRTGFAALQLAARPGGNWIHKVFPSGAELALRRRENETLQLRIWRREPLRGEPMSPVWWEAASKWEREVQTFALHFGATEWEWINGTTKTGGPLVTLVPPDSFL